MIGTSVYLFQCSSASRKFLNSGFWIAYVPDRDRFSALQRAENSSMAVAVDRIALPYLVSVLFSEPKIPQ